MNDEKFLLWQALLEHRTGMQISTQRKSFQETSFFRHQHSFDLVRDYCRKLYEKQGRKHIELWSVGCATGEEPCSLSMVMDDLVKDFPGKRYYGITARSEE